MSTILTFDVSGRAPKALKARLAHEGHSSRGEPLNSESVQFAWLYQHSETPLRQKLWAVVLANGCRCLSCLRQGKGGA